MHGWIMIGVAVSLLAAATGGRNPVPLSPVGKWSVDYNPMRCIASRTFRGSDSDTTLAFTAVPLTKVIGVSLLAQNGSAGTGRAKLSVGELVDQGGSYNRQIVPTSKQRVTTMSLNRATFEHLVDPRNIEITLGQEAPLTFPIAEAPALSKALASCQADLAKSWGVSELPEGAVAAEPIRPETWIEYTDYPTEAVAGRLEGTTFFGWTIGVDGKPTDCRILISSGHRILDAASCGAILKRGRYKPAMDAAGTPIISYATRRASWNMPR